MQVYQHAGAQLNAHLADVGNWHERRARRGGMLHQIDRNRVRWSTHTAAELSIYLEIYLRSAQNKRGVQFSLAECVVPV